MSIKDIITQYRKENVQNWVKMTTIVEETLWEINREKVYIIPSSCRFSNSEEEMVLDVMKTSGEKEEEEQRLRLADEYRPKRDDSTVFREKHRTLDAVWAHKNAPDDLDHFDDLKQDQNVQNMPTRMRNLTFFDFLVPSAQALAVL